MQQQVLVGWEAGWVRQLGGLGGLLGRGNAESGEKGVGTSDGWGETSWEEWWQKTDDPGWNAG